ncbi:hypothetical protein BC829DRAFT_390793, partial [Chytridium lagenaria]
MMVPSVSTTLSLLLTLTATVHLVNAQTANSSDPCSIIRGRTMLEADAVYRCYRSFQISAVDRQKQIDALLALTQVYPYTNLAKSKIDIVASLTSLHHDTSLTSDFDFHSRISLAINKLQDGHFSYAAKCYSSIQFFQPWIVSARYNIESSKPILYLRDTVTSGTVFGSLEETDLMLQFTRNVGRDPALLVGYDIESIDGRDPVDVVQEFADNYAGFSHTPETRFNFVLASTQYSRGQLVVEDGSFFTTRRSFFDRPTIRNYTLRDPITKEAVFVSIPWLGFLPMNISTPVSSSTFRRIFCETVSTVPSETSSLGSLISENATMLPSQKAVIKKLPPAAILTDDYNAFYFLPEIKTGVFAMSTFEATYYNGSSLEIGLWRDWLRTISDGLLALEERNATNLVIDFTNNGGGQICVGKALLAYLFPEAKFVQYDIRATSLNSYLVRTSSRSPYSPFNLNIR